MEEDSRDLQDDIRKLQETLKQDGTQFYEYIIDSEDESDDDVLYIDLAKNASATQSVASASAHSAGAAASIQSTGESQSVVTETEDDAEVFREVGVVFDKLDSISLPPTIESCLVMNRAYQDVIIEHIARIELELAENREAQRRSEEEARESRIHQNTRKRFPYSMATPYFKMRGNLAPPPNEDVVLKKHADEPDLDARPESAWLANHKRQLITAVCEDVLEKILQPLLSRRELEEEKLLSTVENSPEFQQIKDRIAAIDQEMEEKRKMPQEVLLQKVDTERVDWMKIANITFQGRRNWMSCRRTWQHIVDPHLNHQPVTEEEEQRMSELIQETNGLNWVYIAQQLGTGRTAFQCLQYYQQYMNSEMLDRPWTKAEDKRLINVVYHCQQMHFNWSKVAQYMEGRSGAQCYKRFSKLDPNISKGLWTETEDAQLMMAVQLLGSSNWGRVAELVPNRTREQCRERYLNSLDPTISGKPWTYEEDKKLLELKEKYGKGSWVKISKELPGRTDNQILQRFRRFEDWRNKEEWFGKLSDTEKDLMLGNNLPSSIKKDAQGKNWEQFRQQFGVLPEDYNKQRADISKGGLVVPRPPPMLGLANRSGAKMWERRYKLHKLIERHINQLREKYSFACTDQQSGSLNASVAGVCELQDEIAQLSKECLVQRDKLLSQGEQERRSKHFGLLIHKGPSGAPVKDILAVSRGKQLHEPQRRGPRRHKQACIMARRLKISMMLDAELRKVVRANLKERSLKKGRPRRLFWDIKGDQRLGKEELADLKATTMNLYMKSLGVDHVDVLIEGRKSFPELFRKLQNKERQKEMGSEVDTLQEEDSKVRRSKRVSKIKKELEEEEENKDPFSLSGNAAGKPFVEWTKQRDFEMLEWLARHDALEVNYEPPVPVALEEEIPMASCVDVRTAGKRETAISPLGEESALELSAGNSRISVGCGMQLVQASIQQAVTENEAEMLQRAAGSNHRSSSGAREATAEKNVQPLFSGAGDALNAERAERISGVVPGVSLATARAGVSHRATATESPDGCQQPQGQSQETPLQARSAAASSSGGPRRQLPNIPPTATTVNSFRELLLKRLGLIKTAGPFYNLEHYMRKRDKQLAELIEHGTGVQELNRGTMDLNRMMNRISQDTDFLIRKPYKKKGQPSTLPNEPRKVLDYRVLDAVRQTDEFKLLESRFQSLFLWPSLLSTIYPPFIRTDYNQQKGSSRIKEHLKDLPHYAHSKRKLPMLKTKRFYRFSNKSIEEKNVIVQKIKKTKILKQVRKLLADENDPNPHVTLDPDSDDPDLEAELSTRTSSGAKEHDPVPPGGVPSDCERDKDVVSVSMAADRAAEPQPGASSADSWLQNNLGRPKRTYKKKTYKKKTVKEPSRHSTRVTERKIYEDRINRKNVGKPDNPSKRSGVIRPRALSQFMRRQLIQSMVEIHSKNNTIPPKKAVAVENSRPVNGYVSDDEEAAGLFQELAEPEAATIWDGLAEEQRQSLAVLERETILEHPEANDASQNRESLTVRRNSCSTVDSVSPEMSQPMELGLSSPCVNTFPSSTVCEKDLLATAMLEPITEDFISKEPAAKRKKTEVEIPLDSCAGMCIIPSADTGVTAVLKVIDIPSSSKPALGKRKKPKAVTQAIGVQIAQDSGSLIAIGQTDLLYSGTDGMSVCAVSKGKKSFQESNDMLVPAVPKGPKSSQASSSISIHAVARGQRSARVLSKNLTGKRQDKIALSTSRIAAKTNERDPEAVPILASESTAVDTLPPENLPRAPGDLPRALGDKNIEKLLTHTISEILVKSGPDALNVSCPEVANSSLGSVDVKSDKFDNLCKDVQHGLSSSEYSDCVGKVEKVSQFSEDLNLSYILTGSSSDIAFSDIEEIAATSDDSLITTDMKRDTNELLESKPNTNISAAVDKQSFDSVLLSSAPFSGQETKALPCVNGSGIEEMPAFPDASIAALTAAAASFYQPTTAASGNFGLPMANVPTACIPGVGVIQPSIALAIPAPDQGGLVLLLPNSADPHGPPIQINIPLPIVPFTLGSPNAAVASSIAVPANGFASPSLPPSSPALPQNGAAGLSRAASSAGTPPPAAQQPWATSSSASARWATPEYAELCRSPAIKDGVFRRIPAGQTLELDTDSDAEPSGRKPQSAKPSRTGYKSKPSC